MLQKGGSELHLLSQGHLLWRLKIRIAGIVSIETGEGCFDNSNVILPAPPDLVRKRGSNMDTGISSPSIIRPLAALEHLFAAYSEVGAMTFCVVAEVSGIFSIESFRRAAGEVQRRHGLLRAGIRREGTGRAFFKTAEPIPVQLKPDAGDGWEAEAARELNRPFDVADGPLVRFIGIRNSADRTHLIATFHHAIADGMSAVFVIRDLLRALGGHTLMRFEDAESMDGLLGESLAEMLTVTDLPFAPQREGQNPWATDVSKLATVKALKLDRDTTHQLYTMARAHETSIHGLLCAAIAKVANELVNGNPVRIMSPINMRPVLGGTEQCGVFMSAAAVPHTASNDVWDDARRSREILSLYRGKEAAVAISAIATAELAIDNSAANACSAMWRYVDYDVMLTNLGRLKLDRVYDGISLEAISGPIVRCCVRGENVIGVSTYQDELTLVHTTVDGPNDLLQQIETVLRGL
jgi:NRPS condensation-like uncharacterized protein